MGCCEYKKDPFYINPMYDYIVIYGIAVAACARVVHNVSKRHGKRAIMMVNRVGDNDAGGKNAFMT